MKKSRKIVLSVFVIFLVLGLITGFYFGDYYHYQASDADVYESDSASIAIYKDRIVVAAENPRAGLLFYPGGKVEPDAYIPLLEALADEGYFCVLMKMPGNLAILNGNAAEGIADDYPEVDSWYIGGHSLGGVMAGNYAAGHADELEGVILLGAYTNKDISDLGLAVLSLYGTEDGVMNRENYEKYRSNLPEDLTEVIIEGGCHSYFGSYGMQDGDGTPSITREEQMRFTAAEAGKLLNTD